MKRRFVPFALVAAVAAASLTAWGETPNAASTPASPGSVAASPAPTPVLTLDAAKEIAQSDWVWFDDSAPKGLPLPFHTIEGYGGGAITPIAYLVNPGPKNAVFGKPAAAFSYVNLGTKDLEAFTVSETLFGRLELSYGLDRLGVGTLPAAIKKATTVDINRDAVWLHNFNARFAVLEENSFDTKWLPALTLGVHYKYNSGVSDVNKRLGGALSNIGYNSSSGVDFTATLSKTFGDVFGRPLIVSAGVRESQAAHLGLLGFGKDWSATFEGNIVYLPTDWLLIAYEFRQKDSPYSEIPGLVGKEDNWHAIDASWLINNHMTLTAGVGAFGTLANSEANSSFWLQFKYEF